MSEQRRPPTNGELMIEILTLSEMNAALKQQIELEATVSGLMQDEIATLKRENGLMRKELIATFSQGFIDALLSGDMDSYTKETGRELFNRRRTRGADDE